MKNIIKAIETKYKGHRFRSRLEARWAVFFDYLDEPWEYEKEGYELPSGLYLPDFWMPRMECWIEIKGQLPTVLERKICEELAIGLDNVVIIASGIPYSAYPGPYYPSGHVGYVTNRLSTYIGFIDHGGGARLWWDDCYFALTKNNQLCISDGGHPDRERQFMTPLLTSAYKHFFRSSEVLRPISERDVSISTSARFEYGDSK